MIEKNLNERRQVEKKILPEYYKEIRTHRKMFEIRKDEDNFQVGDIIVLREWDGEKYTGNKTRREITYILRNAEGYGLKEGYCILSLQVPGWDHFRPQAVLDEEKTQLSEETSTNEVDTPTNTSTNDPVSKSEILGYIDRVKNSGLGKQKSLEYISKYVDCMETQTKNGRSMIRG